MKISLGEAALIMKGELSEKADPKAEVTGLVVDSREVAVGSLFAALKGDFLDGHDFVTDAAARGAIAALVTRPVDSSLLQILVSDVLEGLTGLASHFRDVVDPIVVGITGSNGKTSTRDLVSSVSSMRFNTVAAQRNYNNEIGVPLTLLKLRTETELLVCELGARGPGQIKSLCDLVRPQIGIVTNVGVSHFELFGSIEAIASTKAELVSSLDESGTAVLNFDDPLVFEMKETTQAQIITFGLLAGADVSATDLAFDSLGRPRFRVKHRAASAWFELNVSGIHQVHNALAAVATGIALGLDLEECSLGLGKASGSPWRMEIEERSSVLFVNDAYNASPASMKSALETSKGMVGAGGRLIAILGYMAELGELEVSEHLNLGELAAAMADVLIVVGALAAPIVQGAKNAGAEAMFVETPEQVPALLQNVAAGDVVLVKGSRAAGLEKLIGQIQEKTGL